MSPLRHFNHKQETGQLFLTRVDSRLKLVAAIAILLMVISSKGFAFPLLTALLCGSLCLSLGVRPKLLALRFAEPLFIALIVVLLKFFLAGKEEIFSVSLLGLPLAGHYDGLLEGLGIASRIAGAVAVVAALGFATPFTELMGALAWLRVPHGFIEISMFAWRYLFVLLDDAQVVYAAQRNRLGYAGYRRGLRSFGTLTGALVVKAFDNSQAITIAMVQRGYDGTMPLTKQKPFCFGEVAVSFVVVTIIGFLWHGL